MIKENVEIVGSVDVANDIKNKVRTTGVRGLDFEKATELGVFQRIANLLCVTHASVMAAYLVYGEVGYLMDELKARRNEIAREMNMFDKAFDRFVKFWTGYYASGTSAREVNYETERLYHKIMEWMQMPETWQLGEEQRTTSFREGCIRIDLPDDKVFTFYKAELNHELVGEPKETWGVFCYDPNTGKQTSVYTDMDKASALMVAKRLSDENPDNIYSASIIRDLVEKRTEVMPFKAFKGNETVGKLTE
jgi:hypothetical protein